MSRKVIAALGIVGFLASAGVAFAQTTTSNPMPMVLHVGVNGNVLLRGTVSSVSAGWLTVKSWGGYWTVNVPSSAQVFPSGTALTSFQQGDFVGVIGSIDSSAGFTVDATIVRDWTARTAMKQQIQANVQQARTLMSNRPRVTQGTLSNFDAANATFTLTTAAGTAYSVTLNSGAETIGRNWATISLSQANNGDTVRVYGTVSSSTIAASVFRDVSVK